MEKKLITIGLIGGMSWESTVTYYQVINETVKDRLGGLHSAKILLYSVDFAEIEHFQSEGRWTECASILGKAAYRLEQAGADFIVICTNTMHRVAKQVANCIDIPLLHIAEATANVLNAEKVSKVLLLGTKYTMQQDFYKQKLLEAGIDVVVPNNTGIAFVNGVIYDELCRGIISDVSRKKMVDLCLNIKQKNDIQGVILGCTEIGLLLKQEDLPACKVFDTTLIHARRAALLSL